MKIRVYVRSNLIVQGMQKHQNVAPYMGGACSQHSTYLLNNAIEDRLLEPESMEVVQAAQRLARAPAVEVEFVDVGFWLDWGLSLLVGVWKTPAVVVDGVRYTGLVSCVRVLEGQAALT